MTMDATQNNATAWVARLMSTIGRPTDNRPTSSVNVLVYRVGSLRSLQHRARSNMFTAFGTKKGFFERSGLSCKQWLLVILEMLLSFVWWVIAERRKHVDDLLRKGLTERQILIDSYLRKACGSFISLFVGYLADTYYNMYVMAIFNVTLHFVLNTILFMEIVIRLGDYNIYQEFVFQTVGMLLIPLKATDFTRLAYGLQHIGRSNVRSGLLFIFFSVWLSERAVGGFLVAIASSLKLTWENSIRLGFALSGVTLGAYIYAFTPSKDRFEDGQGPVGNDFVGCIVTAIRNRRLFRSSSDKPLDWLDYSQNKYERATIDRTRSLLKLYFLILPTVGFSLYAVPRTDFYEVLWNRLLPSGIFLATGVQDGAAITVILSMGVLQFILLPLTEKFGLRRSFLGRFIGGYMCALFCMLYTTSIVRTLEVPLPGPRTGMIRIFNARNDPVRIISQDPSVTSFDYEVPPKRYVLLGIEIREEKLVQTKFVFSEANITAYLSAQPNIMRGYLLLQPAAIVKMGELPVRELAAGSNDPRRPKQYVFNALSTKVTVEFRDRKGPYLFHVEPGGLNVRQLEVGIYYLRTMEFESSGARRIKVETGGFYGIIVHESSLETLLTAETLLLHSHRDTVYMLGVTIPYAFALVLTYVSLRAMVFLNTPDGMEGLSFGFLDFLDNMTYWVIWIGHVTWHPFITSFALGIYTFLEVLTMFWCIFVFIRYGNWYKFRL